MVPDNRRSFGKPTFTAASIPLSGLYVYKQNYVKQFDKHESHLFKNIFILGGKTKNVENQEFFSSGEELLVFNNCIAFTE